MWARVSPGRLKVLDAGISMNLIQPPAWLDIVRTGKRFRASLHDAARCLGCHPKRSDAIPLRSWHYRSPRFS